MSLPFHCKYCHCSFANIIIHSSSAHPLLNHWVVFFCYIKFLLLLIELLIFHVTSGIESLQPYPSRLLHQELVLLIYIFLPFFVGCCLSALLPGGGAALHLSLPLGFCLGFLLVGELQLDQMSFDPLPSLPRNPLWSYIKRVPLDA